MVVSDGFGKKFPADAEISKQRGHLQVNGVEVPPTPKPNSIKPFWPS